MVTFFYPLEYVLTVRVLFYDEYSYRKYFSEIARIC